MTELTDLQKHICNELQSGLEIIEEPFEVIASRIGCTHSRLLEQVKQLKLLGVIRRISASVNYAALGRVSTLVTAHVPGEKLEGVAAKINSLEGVSHNYLREHHFNLWFTLQAPSQSALSQVLDSLQACSGIEFHPLPAMIVFKLDVRFDAFSNGTSLLPRLDRNPLRQGIVPVSQQEMHVLKLLQADLPVEPRPFDKVLADSNTGLDVIRSLHDRGVLKQIACVVDYRKLGFAANAMAVFAVDPGIIEQVGHSLARSSSVSHCYHRPPFAGWPYTLFAMMHGRDVESLHKLASAFASANGITCFQLLPTLAELKKKPVSL